MSAEKRETAKAPSKDAPGEPQANGASGAPTDKKLSGAELKKLKQQEKAAKRAAQKEAQGSPAPSQSQSQPSTPKQQQSRDKAPKNASEKQSQASKPQAPKPHQHAAKARRGSETKKDSPAHAPIKQVRLFSHLYGQPRRHSLVGASKDIHPAVLALGLQISSYEICGSNARCVAMLLAFKSVGSPATTCRRAVQADRSTTGHPNL